MGQGDIKVGLIGAGYIARWHAEVLARLPGVHLAAICDPAPGSAQALADGFGARAFASADEMLAQAGLDAVHVLAPPPLHHRLTMQALEAGADVLVEKPFALDQGEAAEMVARAQALGRRIAVNHNFLGLPGHARLRQALDDGLIGRVDSAEINWRFPLPPLRTGPFGLWLLQSPQNLLRELGPHLHAFVHDLLGPLEEATLRLSRPITLPTGATVPQGWVVQGCAGGAQVTLSVSLVEGHDDRSVNLRGTAGQARLDFANDTLVLARANASDIVLNPLRNELSLAGQHLREGLRNAWRQARSLNRRQPYALGFEGVFNAFYGAIRRDEAVPVAFSGEAALAVTREIDTLCAELPAPAAAPKAPAVATADQPVQALVIGGTGFLGRELVRQLAKRGIRTGVLSRARANPFADLGVSVRLISAAMDDQAALTEAMRGVDTVYHLARAEEPDWEGYLRNDVAVTERLAEAALDAGVRRFVYTGTIASYDASDPFRTITEDTPFGEMQGRNLYARSKALCEERLMALHRDRGLGLVIARPGIVVGPGGPLQHWGIGRWHGAGAVRLWGDGRNKLPFVLNEDVAEALIRMREVDGIEGQSFNLVGPPLMSAREWFDAIARLTGTRIAVSGGNLTLFWLGGRIKHALKTHLLRRKGLLAEPLRDWRGRAHLSKFSHQRAVDALGWQPESDAKDFARKALEPAALFGF